MTSQTVRGLHGCCAALLALAGCTTSSAVPSRTAHGSASSPVAMAPDRRTYSLAMGEISSGGNPIRRVPPVYPASELAACPPPRDVQAQLMVDGTGKVSDVHGMVMGAGSATPRWQPFSAAVRAATLQWRFTPLQIAHWAADADGNSHAVDSKLTPFRRAYVFRFSCHAGRPVVTVTAVAAAALR